MLRAIKTQYIKHTSNWDIHFVDNISVNPVTARSLKSVASPAELVTQSQITYSCVWQWPRNHVS